MNKLTAYLKLMRVSLLPTAWSNVLMGFLIANGNWHAPLEIGLLLIISSCMYLGGMVLNDVMDVESDREQAPHRPLVNGPVSVARARWLAISLFAIAMLVALILQFDAPGTLDQKNQTTLPVACALLAFIVAYNCGGKKHFFGPVLMGGCRTFNVLLGGSIFLPRQILETPAITPPELIPALAIGLYVAGITWLARREHGVSRRLQLALSGAVMLAGVGLLCWYPWSTGFDDFHLLLTNRNKTLFLGLLAMMIFPVVRKVAVAASSPSPARVKQAVVISLLTIIMLDASVCYLVSPTNPAYALSVAALVIPAFLLSRRVLAT